MDFRGPLPGWDGIGILEVGGWVGCQQAFSRSMLELDRICILDGHGWGGMPKYF